MVAYSEFDALVGRLKQSAIDAYMKEEGWELRDGKYEIDSRGTDSTVTRPGDDGEGGGNWDSDLLGTLFGLHDRDEEFIAAFNEVRSAIDDAVQYWDRLPDPGPIGDVVEICRQVSQRLSVNASTAGGEVSGGGNLPPMLNTINEYIGSMSGTTIGTYKAIFLTKLGQAVSGFHAISVVRGANIAAQQGLWETARQDCAEILDGARKAFDKVAQGEGTDWGTVLKVVGFAGKGLALFTPAGPPSAIAAFGLGIDILKDVQSAEEKKTVAAPTYSSVLGGITTMLQALSDRVKTEEEAIDANFVTNLSNIRSEKGSYDLTQPAITSSDDVIVYQRALVDEITDIWMPGISADLQETATLCLECSTYSEVTRPSTIGLGPTGPSSNTSELNWLLYELVKSLSQEVTYGAANLRAAVNDMAAHEQATQDALNQAAAQVTEGSAYDPWN